MESYMRTVEFIRTNDSNINALFKEDGQIVYIRYVGVIGNCNKAIQDWLLDGQVSSTMC